MYISDVKSRLERKTIFSCAAQMSGTVRKTATSNRTIENLLRVVGCNFIIFSQFKFLVKLSVSKAFLPEAQAARRRGCLRQIKSSESSF